MELIVRKLETKVMEVVPNRLSMDSQTVLTQYIIKNWTLDYVDQNDPSRGITMVLVFRRRIMNAILTITSTLDTTQDSFYFFSSPIITIYKAEPPAKSDSATQSVCHSAYVSVHTSGFLNFFNPPMPR